MLHARAVEYRTGEIAILPGPVAVDGFAGEAGERRRQVAEQALDQVLADSFPASDPPSWNPGIVRPDPVASRAAQPAARETRPPDRHQPLTGVDTIVLVSEPIATERSFVERLAAGVGALLVAMLLPLGILLAGLPVAYAIRWALELVGRALGANLV